MGTVLMLLSLFEGSTRTVPALPPQKKPRHLSLGREFTLDSPEYPI